MQEFKCGYVALLGQPNAGKSTLMNASLGTKLAVVSAKPQTTRNRILGVCTLEKTQIMFLDTPGIHRTTGLPKLNVKMTATAWSVVGDADLNCYLVDTVKGWTEDDTIFFRKLLAVSTSPVVVVATKSDKIKTEVVEQNLALINEHMQACFEEVKVSAARGTEASQLSEPRLLRPQALLLSAKRPAEVKLFREFLAAEMPAGPWLYEADDITDRPQQFVCGELIREQLFRQLGQELPYSAAVKVERFVSQRNLISIQASVIVHKDNHKGMVIGSRGSRIKAIGQAARESLEKHLGRKVHLELFVKVQSNWIDSDNLLAEYAGLERLEE